MSKHELKKNPRVMLAGSVNSSLTTLRKLTEHKMNVCGVLGLSKKKSSVVSGYKSLEEHASDNGYDFLEFENINSESSLAFIKKRKPDLLFVVGLSQLVKEELLQVPTYGCIGFHPTRLPEGRGRGAVAWLVLGKAEGAATFFKLDEGMDSGPILIQEPFSVDEKDYSSDVIKKIVGAIEQGLDKALPEIKKGMVQFTEQDHTKATYLGRRRPEDGLINWSESNDEICKLIRATASPLPGAYTYYLNKKIVIEKVVSAERSEMIGVTGRILKNDDEGVLVQTGEKQVLIKEISGMQLNELRAGVSLGLNVEAKVFELEKRISELENQIHE